MARSSGLSAEQVVLDAAEPGVRDPKFLLTQQERQLDDMAAAIGAIAGDG